MRKLNDVHISDNDQFEPHGCDCRRFTDLRGGEVLLRRFTTNVHILPPGCCESWARKNIYS
ncbi:unnamed protein product [Penicillium salamii]|uniref:Uncharacterized protein n=1 Tax=Penicillium salamii TaxID=1612424 RepID=A0A9W4I7C2_9EURO|nr:unnamed protein product [Penicillium salamii]